MTLKLGSSSVVVGREDGSKTGLECIMRQLEINSTLQLFDPEAYLAVNIDGFSIRGKHPILSLKNLSFESEVRLHNKKIVYSFLSKPLTKLIFCFFHFSVKEKGFKCNDTN